MARWLKYAGGLVVMLGAGVLSASGQFTIQRGLDSLPARVNVEAGIAPEMTTATGGYFDPAAWRAEQRRIRRERNSVEFNATLQTSLQQYENWKAGGTNNISLLGHVDFRHIYKREGMLVDYTFTTNYGMNLIESVLFKNRDDFKFSGMVQWAIHNAWSYSAQMSLESQYSPSHKSRTDATVVSSFMAPGKFAVSVGVTYRPKDIPIVLTLSPIGGNVVTKFDRRFYGVEFNGVAANRWMLAKLGPSVTVNYDRPFGRDKQYRYRTTLYVFSNLQSPPIVQWNNTVDIRITRYLSTTGTFQLYFDEASSSRVQYNYALMVGLAYKFKNK